MIHFYKRSGRHGVGADHTEIWILWPWYPLQYHWRRFHHKAGACGKQSGFYSGHRFRGQHGTHLGRFSDFFRESLYSKNPRTRSGLNYYLDAVGVSEYDPIQLVEKTHGRMAEDHKWLKITWPATSIKKIGGSFQYMEICRCLFYDDSVSLRAFALASSISIFSWWASCST